MREGNVVKTKRDEEKWEKAKGIAEDAGHKEDYAYVMGIYKRMKPDYEFKNMAARVASEYLRTANEREYQIGMAEEVLDTVGRDIKQFLQTIIKDGQNLSNAVDKDLARRSAPGFYDTRPDMDVVRKTFRKFIVQHWGNDKATDVLVDMIVDGKYLF